MRARILGSLALSLVAARAEAGSYLGTTFCTETATQPCAPGTPESTRISNPENLVNPQSIVHAQVFQEAGGSFTLRLCTTADASTGVPQALQWAVGKWNALVPTTQNCHRCTTVELGETLPPTEPYMLSSALLHEVGHCALALDHPNMKWDVDPFDGVFELTSVTRSWGAAAAGGTCNGNPSSGICIGPDLIAGSSDDTQDALGPEPPSSVSWFLRGINNPVLVDPSITIDTDTFSRSVTAAGNLPPGHSWPANANLRVA